MQINFERSGGILGRKSGLILDLDELPPEQAARLRELLDQCDFFNLPTKFAPAGGPDEFQYRITVDLGDHRHTIEAGETALPAALRPLVSELSQRARSKRA